MRDSFLADFYHLISSEEGKSASEEDALRAELSTRGVDYKRLRFRSDGECLLNQSGSMVLGLEPISDLPVTHLCLQGCWGIEDFSPLEGMNLIWLNLSRTTIADLRPLHEMSLTYLRLWRTRVECIHPLSDTPLQGLDIRFSPVDDLSPLGSVPLRHLSFFPGKVTRGLDVLASMPYLETINGRPAQKFLKRYRLR